MNIPRQPFVGLAIAAALGIILADYFPIAISHWLFAGILFVASASAVFGWARSGSTYLVVAAAFFLIHNFLTADTAGLKLAEELSERPRTLRATGFVSSEPKVAPNRQTLHYWFAGTEIRSSAMN